MTTPIAVDQVTDGCWVACLAGLTHIAHDHFIPLVPKLPGRIMEDRQLWQEYHNAVVEFLHQHGWTYLDCGSRIPKGFCVAIGPSERGVNHAVIAYDGKCWHDPHPSRAGLLRVTSYEIVIPILGLLDLDSPARGQSDG